MSIARTCVVIAFFALSIGQPAASARAEDFAECRQLGGAGPDRVVAVCTAAISAGALGREDLATAFASRGAGFRSLHQDDRAFEDFARAILLDPLCITAYHQRGLLHLDRGETEWARQDFGVAARIERNSADTRAEDF